MSKERKQKTYAVTWLIRRLFRAMSQEADRYLGQWGLTAADRAVMEFLFPDEKLTVPAIADRYDVSRQHVQIVVNGLKEKGLLLIEPNPKHKRSLLLCLSPEGSEVFTAIRKRESTIVGRVFAEVSDHDLNISHSVLESMYRQLKQMNEVKP